MTYAEISNTEADRYKSARTRRMASTPWQFENVTPFELQLNFAPFHADAAAPNTDFTSQVLGTLAPRETRSFMHDSAGRVLGAGGQIGVVAPGRYLSAYVLDPQYKLVRLGAAVGDAGGIGENYHNLHADISGVYIHNRFAFPLEVKYRGNVVGHIGPYDGMNFLGGSNATLYFDNAGAGLSYMDTITFSQLGGPFLYRIQLNDTKLENIHVGAPAPVVTLPVRRN